ncbi:MAG: Y-family DNA polymerase [Xanthomonadales bacterium]|nr:Y-family DNA polymerase [Xanthomonadales bacterium]MDZ4115468.1 Y-family DNA polymerase [Xanthomonadaceae bacterium]
MFGLVDGNNFYASCERVFQPELIGKPVVVLSNNDGCCIARSDEAKALGVKMAQPIFEVAPHIRSQLIIRSANFGLYGDLSGRIVTILRDLFARVEVYSIDESFISFEGVRDRMQAAAEARARILQWTGIPCCVGIAPTKTLAKAANKLAKKHPSGVTEIDNPSDQLKHFPVADVWGVGRRLTARLGEDGILTARNLLDASTDTLRARYGVTLARTQRELQGLVCTDLQDAEPDRQQIICSRSFGHEIIQQQDLHEAVATFAVMACEKLRARRLKASGVWVWLNTNAFKPGQAQYHPGKAMNFVAPTSDTREVLTVASALTRAMYRTGYQYKKAGVGLLDLTQCDQQQGDLFAGEDVRSTRTMAVLDQVNQKYGRGTLGFAMSGWRRTPQWGMRQENLSKAFTTKWDQLLRVV